MRENFCACIEGKFGGRCSVRISSLNILLCSGEKKGKDSLDGSKVMERLVCKLAELRVDSSGTGRG